MSIRQLLEEREQKLLSPHATLSVATKGREKALPPCDLRTEFQRDRDRILYSRAFSRLRRKTQVLISPRGDHYRTRLTHTLEVSQIARTIARALRLNEDLVEAIAMGHDLGHSPFGHTGEYALNSVHPPGFYHSCQSVRLVESLERDGQGLNLTYEVRDGILKHSKSYTKIIADDPNVMPATLEGQIVRISDSLAYINHDIDDGLQVGILKQEDIPQELLDALGYTLGERIGRMVRDVIMETTRLNLERVAMSAAMLEPTEALRKFLFDNFYLTPTVNREADKSKRIVTELYDYFLEHPDHMDLHLFGLKPQDDVKQVVCDYIACMTDDMALEAYIQAFIPKRIA
ncbi:deoxyguanosinetriphosphate triphosphohydrolase [candidate division KSB3 bacterium]|uniref:Deoxyguanosinetriphosphate triphosphohydrolase-like protein n=1 Tax=candidate division KSB3 bacterium TaxID=2044937 RepID=A0A9D5JS40_9BACT|nr:deoxyguanosinetriphosphate triphosphohydrolase [candidate division KSB3 bacterium]MBD3323002.1 deoxyguanosinetriphosphate triphosphohydrolase [candidate division KSB3 bacterium]